MKVRWVINWLSCRNHNCDITKIGKYVTGMPAKSVSGCCAEPRCWSYFPASPRFYPKLLHLWGRNAHGSSMHHVKKSLMSPTSSLQRITLWGHWKLKPWVAEVGSGGSQAHYQPSLSPLLRAQWNLKVSEKEQKQEDWKLQPQVIPLKPLPSPFALSPSSPYSTLGTVGTANQKIPPTRKIKKQNKQKKPATKCGKYSNNQ